MLTDLKIDRGGTYVFLHILRALAGILSTTLCCTGKLAPVNLAKYVGWNLPSTLYNSSQLQNCTNYPNVSTVANNTTHTQKTHCLNDATSTLLLATGTLTALSDC